MPVHEIAQRGFDTEASTYDRTRPSYPSEAVAWMVEQLGIGPGSLVVDLAAGTGKLTRLLACTHARVIAVEPVEGMRAVLQERVPGIEIMHGVAEALPLPDATADVVTVAQAFHWFDHAKAVPELRRVLKPGGCLVLIWNSRDMSDPLQHALEELLAPLREEAPYQLGGAWRGPLEESGLFGPAEEAQFAIGQELTTEGVSERVASTSFVAAMSPAEREALLERVRALSAGRPEPFAFPYVTEVYLTRTR